jgi:hypothetical protein
MTSSSTGDESATDRLYVELGSGRPPFAELTVFDGLTTHLAGHEVTSAVIGSSHCVHVPAADCHEIVACHQFGAGQARELSIPDDEGCSLSFAADGLAADTTVETRPIESLPDQSFALRYEFAPGADTVIALSDGGYETYHLYPEFDRLVHTETHLTTD